MISNYESRFLQVRSIIEKQDAEMKAAQSTLESLRDQLASEEQKSRSLRDRIAEMERSYRSSLEEAKYQHNLSNESQTERFKKQMQ